jgi:hypothetical protein
MLRAAFGRSLGGGRTTEVEPKAVFAGLTR